MQSVNNELAQEREGAVLVRKIITYKKKYPVNVNVYFISCTKKMLKLSEYIYTYIDMRI